MATDKQEGSDDSEKNEREEVDYYYINHNNWLHSISFYIFTLKMKWNKSAEIAKTYTLTHSLTHPLKLHHSPCHKVRCNVIQQRFKFALKHTNFEPKTHELSRVHAHSVLQFSIIFTLIYQCSWTLNIQQCYPFDQISWRALNKLKFHWRKWKWNDRNNLRLDFRIRGRCSISNSETLWCVVFGYKLKLFCYNKKERQWGVQCSLSLLILMVFCLFEVGFSFAIFNFEKIYIVSTSHKSNLH